MEYYKKIQPGIGGEVVSGAVHSMARFMQRYYGKEVIILLDEYDTPMITGITRIARESIFSGLNNPQVVTTTSNKYADFFGFTEQEVFKALDDAGLGAEKQKVKKRYAVFVWKPYGYL